MIKVVFSALCTALLISACSFSIKSEYPEIHYYDMTDGAPQQIAKSEAISQSIYIKPFSSLSQFDTDQMIEKRDENKIHRFFYHRWIEDFSDLFRNITIAQLKRSEISAAGVISNAAEISTPELVLEAQVIDAMAYAIDDSDNYSVTLEVEFTLKKYETSDNQPILLKKIYKESIKRDGDEANTINIAFAKAANIILKNLQNDIQQNAK